MILIINLNSNIIIDQLYKYAYIKRGYKMKITMNLDAVKSDKLDVITD